MRLAVQPTMTMPLGRLEESMLKHLPSVAKVPSTATDCTTKASTSTQVNNGAGLQLVWTIAPSTSYLKDNPQPGRRRRKQWIST